MPLVSGGPARINFSTIPASRMPIIIKKRFESSNNYRNSDTNNRTKTKRIKNSHKIVSNRLLDIIRDNERFNKENFYSLNLTHLNTYLNKILKDQNRYEECVKYADYGLACFVSTRFIRIHYLSKHIFSIKVNRFKITLTIIKSGKRIFIGQLDINQDALNLILKNAPESPTIDFCR